MKKKLAAVGNILAACLAAGTAGFNIFAAFIFGGVAAVSLVFILAASAGWVKLKKPPSRLVGFFQIVLGGLLWSIFKYFCSLKIKGRENIRHLKNGNRPVLFIANHQGLLDPMVLVLAVPPRLRPVRFLASTWIFRDKIMGKLAEATGGIQIPALVLKPEGMNEEEWKTKRRLVKMEEIIKILKGNGAVGVFPQGEITNPSLGVRGNIKVGTAQLMLMPEMKNLVVVPMALSGTWGLICHVHNGLTINPQSIYDFIMRRRKLAVNIGKSFILADVDVLEEENNEERLKKISAKIAERIENLII